VTRLKQPPAGYTALRPHRYLFTQALVATNAFLGPVLIVLYVFTIPDGAWPVVLGMQIFASILFTIASAAFFRTAVWVGENGIAERGFFGRLDFHDRDEIARILLAPTFHGDGTATLPQLFVCDANDKQLMRLRGQFWSLESMQAVGEILDMPIAQLPTSDLRDIHAEYPGLLYWFERRPAVAACVFSAAMVVVGGLVYGALALAGMVPNGA